MNVRFNKDGKTGSIIYDSDDWLAGYDTTSAGSSYGKMGGNPQMSEIDPLRNYGYVSPAFNGVAVTNNSQITFYIRGAAVKGDAAVLLTSGQASAAVNSGARVLNLTPLSSGTTLSTSSPFPHNIDNGSHTGVVGDDITNYYTSGSHIAAFYSYNDDSEWNVGIYDWVSGSFDDDYMTTVPSPALPSPYKASGKGYPHPLIYGDDELFYIGDRNFVHAYDFSTNIFSPEVVKIPPGWVITSFAKTQDLRLAIGAYFVTGQDTSNVYNRGSAKVWYWQYGTAESNFDYAIDLKDNYVSELIPWGNTLAAFTYGRKTLSDAGSNKLQAQNGTMFEVIKSWGSAANILPIRGGIDNTNNDLYWNSGGAVYSYTKRPDNGQYILNNLVTDASTSGMFKFFTAQSTYHMSSGTTSNGGLTYYPAGTTYNNAGSLRCQLASPDFPPEMKGSLKQITIKFKDVASNGRSFRLNTELDTIDSVLIDDMTNISNVRVVQIMKRTDGSPLGDFSSLQPVLIWADNLGGGVNDCPIVEYVKYDFELTNYKP